MPLISITTLLGVNLTHCSWEQVEKRLLNLFCHFCKKTRLSLEKSMMTLLYDFIQTFLWEIMFCYFAQQTIKHQTLCVNLRTYILKVELMKLNLFVEFERWKLDDSLMRWFKVDEEKERGNHRREVRQKKVEVVMCSPQWSATPPSASSSLPPPPLLFSYERPPLSDSSLSSWGILAPLPPSPPPPSSLLLLLLSLVGDDGGQRFSSSLSETPRTELCSLETFTH